MKHSIIHPRSLIVKEQGKWKRFNNWFAVIITKKVGTMICAYLFCILAFSGLKVALRPGGIGFSNWFAEEFIQLVLLPIIIVGQNVIQKANDRKSDADHKNLQTVMKVQEEILDKVEKLEKKK